MRGLAWLLALLVAPVLADETAPPPPLPNVQLGGVTMVPIRAVASALGLQVALDATGRQVTGQVLAGQRAGSFRVTAGSATALVLGQARMLPRPCLAAAGDVYVPLRFLADLVGATLRWDQARRVVAVTRDGQTQELSVAPALYPLVDTGSGLLLGASDGGRWLGATEAMKLISGGERYQLANLTEAFGTATGGQPTLEDPGEYQHIQLDPAPGEDVALAVGAPWELAPRPVALADVTQRVYLDAVAAILKEHRLPAARPNLAQVLRCDLEGDGTEEVLLTGVVPRNEYPQPQIVANDYSFVALRQVVNGQVRTTLLDGEFHARSQEFAAPNRYNVAGLLDLNGDGRLEIVVAWHYYEGAGMVVFELRNGRPVTAVGNGMGA